MSNRTDVAVGMAATSLLRGPVYEDDSARSWNALLDNEAAVRDYFAVIGQRVVLDQVERYAFLRRNDEADDAIPPLVRKHVLSHHVTVLLVVLRDRLAAADADTDSPRAVVTQADLVDQMRLYYPDGTIEDRIISDIGRAENLGYLRKLKDPQVTYEIRRILKAVVTAEWLAEYRERLLHSNDPDADLGDAPETELSGFAVTLADLDTSATTEQLAVTGDAAAACSEPFGSAHLPTRREPADIQPAAVGDQGLLHEAAREGTDEELA